MRDILKQAYSYTDISGQTLTPELAIIRYIFITPEHVKAMNDSDLFLHFIKNIVQERYNVSFPDDLSLCRTYIADCIHLKEALQNSKSGFQEERWLIYTIRLLENIKTPYYPCYAKCLLFITANITDDEIIDDLLKTFYSLIIKSQKEQLELIEKIAESIECFQSITHLNESLLSQIIVENLMLFGQEKSYWVNEIKNQIFYDIDEKTAGRINLSQICRQFLEQELSFTKTEEGCSVTDINEYLARRFLWMEAHKISMESIPKEYQGNTGSQMVDSEFLNNYAYNMNESRYITNPAIGREKEIEDLSLILVSPKKSPILLGEAGVGKTSVVEGLAWNLQNGTVPELLKNKKIMKLTTSALLSDTKYVGEMEARMKQLTGELRANPDVILFIDEIHTIVGAGSTENSNNDIANMLKPYIDRGEIKVIGATTRAEYEEFIAKDKALSRRFYPVYIEEPDEEMTLSILLGTIPAIEMETKIKNPYSIEETVSILRDLIILCDKENQIDELILNRPELPLTLLEMSFAYAAVKNHRDFSVENLRQAVLHSSRLKKEVREEVFRYFTL